MGITENLLEIRKHCTSGYKPLVDYQNWRVAVLNFDKDLLPHAITRLQRHNETDEVFVLLQGRCILFLGEGTETVTALHGQEMLPQIIYNVKKGVWHSHTLSEDAKIVENRDTTYDNSPFCPLSRQQQEELQAITARIWS